MDRATLIRLAEKRRNIKGQSDANLIHLQKVNRVYGDSQDCRENLRVIEAELRWRRQGPDGPFR